MTFRILVLCRGNITRSPFIAGYLYHLYRKSELKDKIHFDIDSSGIEGKRNLPVHPKILEKGLELGFDLGLYRSKHSDLKAYQKADLILVADSQQYRRFRNHYPNLMEKVFKIYDFGREEIEESLDIQDPSHSEVGFTFEEFFEIAVSETERIWNHILQVYHRSQAESAEFSQKLFCKPKSEREASGWSYSMFTKRFFSLCPRCQSKRIRRIKRKGFLQRKLFSFFNGYPYHCGTCGKDSILYIGAEIPSKRKNDAKRSKWEAFMEAEKIHKKSDSTKIESKNQGGL